jgi:Xaa-Pro aminopeptidase
MQSALERDFKRVEKVLEQTPAIDRLAGISTEEFTARQACVWAALQARGFDAGLVFSDEHYDGDVPYLGGNTNIQIEQVAGVIGPCGFHIATGLDGGYVAEQLAPRAKAVVHKTEMLKLGDEEYALEAETLGQVVEAAAGRKARHIALLTPRQVIPASLVLYLEQLFGAENVGDAQDIYYRIKYEKSDCEMRLIRDASVIGDAMMRAMLAVLKPGMLETEVASWGYFVGRQLGAEQMGWDIMVNANTANRTIIGKALNRPIQPGDYVHLGVAPKRDGLSGCVRRSCVAAGEGGALTSDQCYWFQLLGDAYQAGWDAFRDVAENGRPACLAEQALIDFFTARQDEVERRLGHPVSLARLKPYTCVHNAGYTECQEFFGAITLKSKEPLGHQLVLMLDIAIRGIGNRWDEVVVPGMDYLVLENTCGKFGNRLEELNQLPQNVQALVDRDPE